MTGRLILRVTSVEKLEYPSTRNFYQLENVAIAVGTMNWKNVSDAVH